MCGEDVNANGKQGPWGLVIAVICMFFGLVFLTLPFGGPWTSYQGFSSDAVPTINDSGDIDCGGSSLRVVLRGPRVAIPPGDLARRAEEACRKDAVENVWIGIVVGLPLVVVAGSLLVLRARRYRARRRAEGPGDSGDGAVPDVAFLENGTFVRTD